MTSVLTLEQLEKYQMKTCTDLSRHAGPARILVLYRLHLSLHPRTNRTDAYSLVIRVTSSKRGPTP
jgi:hypothetical protein